jgi:flagellar hook-basal body complex protein FliE
MDSVSSLPSLSELLRQNNQISSTSPSARGLEGVFPSVKEVSSVPSIDVSRLSINRTQSVDRVTAPGFSEMFEKFVRGVDQKKKISAQATQDLILGKSDNIHEAMVKSEESKLAFNLMIEVRNKLVDSYKELMRMQV